jgi:hypothetical protein
MQGWSFAVCHNNFDLMPAEYYANRSPYRRVPVDRFKLAKLVLSSVALVGFSDI